MVAPLSVKGQAEEALHTLYVAPSPLAFRGLGGSVTYTRACRARPIRPAAPELRQLWGKCLRCLLNAGPIAWLCRRLRRARWPHPPIASPAPARRGAGLRHCILGAACGCTAKCGQQVFASKAWARRRLPAAAPAHAEPAVARLCLFGRLGRPKPLLIKDRASTPRQASLAPPFLQLCALCKRRSGSGVAADAAGARACRGLVTRSMSTVRGRGWHARRGRERRPSRPVGFLFLLGSYNSAGTAERGATVCVVSRRPAGREYMPVMTGGQGAWADGPGPCTSWAAEVG
jgi:hypothetical protein